MDKVYSYELYDRGSIPFLFIMRYSLIGKTTSFDLVIVGSNPTISKSKNKIFIF
jgi:hypothetical protein